MIRSRLMRSFGSPHIQKPATNGVRSWNGRTMADMQSIALHNCIYAIRKRDYLAGLIVSDGGGKTPIAS